MWTVEIFGADGSSEAYQDVAFTHERFKSHVRFNKEQAFVVRTQDGEIIRALLLRAAGGAPSMFDFQPEGMRIVGTGGVIEEPYFVEQQPEEEWLIAQRLVESD